MRARRDWRVAILLLIVLALASGCASPPKCRTFDQCLAVTQTAITAARELATDLLVRREITPATAQAAQDFADEARASIDLARTLANRGDQRGAQAAYDTALAVLTRAEVKLKERVR